MGLIRARFFLSNFTTAGTLTSLIYNFSSSKFGFVARARTSFFLFHYWKFSAFAGNEFFAMIFASLFYSCTTHSTYALTTGILRQHRAKAHKFITFVALCYARCPNLLTLYVFDRMRCGTCVRVARCPNAIVFLYLRSIGFLTCIVLFAWLFIDRHRVGAESGSFTFRPHDELYKCVFCFAADVCVRLKMPVHCDFVAHSHNINDTKWPITSKCAAYSELHHILRRINVN